MLVDEQDFKSLTQRQQEALFSLSCLSRNQRWTDNVEWTNGEWDRHVIQHGVGLLEEVLDGPLRYLWRDLGVPNNEELVRQRLLEGDELTRYFLAWYLEEHIKEIFCETESDNDASEPDVIMNERGTVCAKLEIKRLANTGNVDEYATSFIQKDWHTGSPRRPSALLLYFPLLITEEWRARSLVNGYLGFIPGLDGWRNDYMYVRAIPAPVNNDTEFGPLKSTRRFAEGLQDT